MSQPRSFDYPTTLSHVVDVLYQQHRAQSSSHFDSHSHDEDCCDDDDGHSHGHHSHEHNPFAHLPSSELRRVLHQLLCIRSPDPPMNESLLNECDAVLSYERTKRELVDAATSIPPITQLIQQQHPTPTLSNISIWRGDITTLRATAIVNAANEQLLGCFQPSHRCIDHVIHSVAGPRLRAACYSIMSQQKHPEPVGNAKITPGFVLPASYVIHTVGPNLNQGKRKSQEPTKEECAQLASCYRSSLDTLLTITPTPSPLTIAFPCISTGLFGFPADRAVEIAMTSVMTWLQQHPEDHVHVIFNVFTDKDEQLYWNYISQLTGVTNITIPRPITVSSSSLLQLASSWFNQADAVVISGGAGMSAAAGLDYNDTELFARLFPAMAKRGHRCMYEFIGYRGWSPALQWGYLLSQLKLARYEWPHHDVYQSLLQLVTQHHIDYFIHTSNADGMFEQNGFPTSRIYTAQGDYSHLQCLKPCSPNSRWPTRPFIDRALPYINPETQEITNQEVIPKCANCGGPVMMQVRGGDWFMEHTFHGQRTAYRTWLQNHITQGHRVVILEIGAGFNTPMVLRWPSERLAAEHDNVKLIRINGGQEHAQVPAEIDQTRAVGLRGNATELVVALCQSYTKGNEAVQSSAATTSAST